MAAKDETKKKKKGRTYFTENCKLSTVNCGLNEGNALCLLFLQFWFYNHTSDKLYLKALYVTAYNRSHIIISHNLLINLLCLRDHGVTASFNPQFPAQKIKPQAPEAIFGYIRYSSSIPKSPLCSRCRKLAAR